ncbi:hypothetical protein KXX16_006503 [Aspergillus fumigatus]|uniref:Uncharacterized protein n=3 Tax=Aspergillus fumigatus TaxID=746128 RepID=Q4WDJ1_ASPFU|nr:conserved hypothetical protein [Aspergillus fumigatus Af293]EDP47492.1 conserved hypothetical protein [Aspergillus fumigatus A1163]KAF4253036.1 hypothetical protein CNMCM8057_005644 [Aspergillus fumigatus]KMK55102.1 hypothetical protein Y699_07207 [Aspergillus fumigatus Z5]EAL85547.1 conserved hypothetical protein [Aspergillus fumigatus Af293]KAF4253811.1 hypothetical protein CNMCM8714_005836 [Aspergillus fumigatus]
MGSMSSLAKTLLIPAVISLALYLLLSFLIVPFFRRYHQRYSQYLPLQAISAHTLSLRDRIADAVMRFFLPSAWRRQTDAQHDNISIFDEEGEIMVGMDMDPSRREALERRRDTADASSRLSRDLEQGFMDDSDDDEDDQGHSRVGR